MEKNVTRLSDEGLHKRIQELSDSAASGPLTPMNAQVYAQINACLGELQRRNIASLVEENKTGSKLSKYAFWVAIISLLFTTAFAYQSWVGDQKWQQQEIDQLKQIRSELENLQK